MKFCCEIKKLLIPGLFLFFSLNFFGQETNSHLSGIVKSEKNEILQNATVIAIHEATKNTYSTQTNEKGYFYFLNIRPGGPYTVSVSHTGYETSKKTNLFFQYGSQQDNDFAEFVLKEKPLVLQQVAVAAKKASEPKFGTVTNITNWQINVLPSISRNLQDYVRLVPQAKVNADGGISLAGQNSKFNAFFIDGASNNDMLGLAPSGINGGQTASPPVSIEAIEEITVLLSPFDVQFSNFTGGSVNAITKSGGNTSKSSAWYYFRNEQMAGKSPQPLEISGSPGIFKRQRMTSFLNQTTGVWASGPLIRNKLFYFLLAEKQTEQQPQQYNFSDYKGNATQQIVNAFADTLRMRYGYEAGSATETKNHLDATRINVKLDWNSSEKNKLSLSYRYNNAERITAQVPNSSTFIRLSNSQYKLIAETHTASMEWKVFFNPKINNRLLFTYTHHVDDRDIVGRPFPQIQVLDGRGIIVAGSNGSAQLNLFKGADLNLFNVVKFIANKQVISTGIDLNFSKLNNTGIGSYFGNYAFAGFNDFFNNRSPVLFTRGVSLVDEPKDDNTKGGARYNTRRLGFFIGDDIQVNDRLKLTAGLRIDGNVLPQSFKTDSFFNTYAKPEIEKYYELEGAQPGQLMNTHWQLSPRIGFNYKIPAEGLTIRGGAGLFTGHILNVWANEIYTVNTFTIDIIPQLNFQFNPDPYNQPGLSLLGTSPVAGRGNISIVSKHFKYPVVFKTSLSADKQLNNGWNFTTELLFTKNVHEHTYTNVNLLPPNRQSALPDERNVFSLTQPQRIPINGGNPYTNIILLGNNKNKKGFSYSFTAVINKNIHEKLMINAAYTYSNSVALFEPNRAANSSSTQWEGINTVNGKNYASRSTSDFDLGHRFFTSLSKKINFSKNKYSTLVTIFYNGQSGSPYSYVYTGSMVNDNGKKSNTDLIYIPTSNDLGNMTFLSYTNSVNNVTYTPQQQKEFLNQFIENDKYLRKHRGEFAERNGARSPFTHVIDLRFQQDFNIRVNKEKLRLSVIYDVFNFTNMLNKNWGRIYLSGDFQLINFAGFSNTATLIPQYQFNPINGKPWSVQPATAPGNSARWISQLGFKLNFN